MSYIMHYILLNVIIFLENARTQSFQPEVQDKKVKPKDCWRIAFFQLLKDIFLIFNLKYNPVILYQLTKLMIIPFMLYVLVFYSSLGRRLVRDRNISINSLLSFIIIIIGLCIFIYNNPDVTFVPGLLFAFLSILFSFILVLNKIDILETNKLLNSQQIELYLLNNDNLNNKSLIIFERSSIFPRIIISLIFGIIFDLPKMFSNNHFSLINQKYYQDVNGDLNDVLKDFLLAISFNSYSVIYLFIEKYRSPSNTSCLSTLLLFIDLFAQPFIVIYIAYSIYPKYPNTKLSVFVFCIGYILYCIFEIKCLVIEMKDRILNEEQNNQEEQLDINNEDDSIFPDELNNVEIRNE